MRMHNNQMLEMAREAIELVILRTQCDVAERGPKQHLLNRIRSLSDALDLIDENTIVVDLMEHSL